jgi:hypothetical protein
MYLGMAGGRDICRTAERSSGICEHNSRQYNYCKGINASGLIIMKHGRQNDRCSKRGLKLQQFIICEHGRGRRAAVSSVSMAGEELQGVQRAAVYVNIT